MGVNIESGFFSGKQEALEKIAAQGLFARDGAMQSGDLEDVHWHKTGLKIYVLEGSFETKDVESGMLLQAGPGDLISIPRETLHAARCPQPAVYVVGFESETAARTFGPENAQDFPNKS